MALSPYQRDIVIRTIAGEALQEGPSGWAGVASVIRNRTQSRGYPTDPASVALQKNRGTYQFTAWSPRYGNSNPQTIKPGSKSYEAIGRVVDGVFDGSIPDLTNGAVNYFNPDIVLPSWGNVLARKNDVTIGNHRFVGRGDFRDPSQMAEAPQRVLRKGDVGDDVAALQYQLANVGLYTGPVDGKFGPQTAEAVRAVQRNANLHLDTGIAGPEVYAALANAGPSVYAAANGPAAASPVSTAEYGFGSPIASGSFAGPQLAQGGTASAVSAPVQLAQSGGANRLAQTGLFSQAPQVAFGGGAVGARAPVQLAQGGRAGGIFAAPQVAQSGGAGNAFRQPTPQLANAGGASGQRATQIAMSPTLRTKDDAFSPASSGSTRVVSAFSTRAPYLGSAGSAGSAVRATSIAASPQASVQRVSYTPAVTRLVSPAAAYNASPAPVGMAMSALGGAEKTQSINPFGTKLANLGAAAEAVAPQQTAVRRVVTAPAAVTYKTVQPNLVPQASLMPQAPAKKEMPNGLFGKIMQNLPVAKAVNGLGNLVSPFNTGAAVDYGQVRPKTNAFAVSPFTPVGFNTPDFTPKSGGAVYAYQTSAPGVGSYINSAGRTMNYNVNADQRVYGNYSGGFGGFQP